MAKQIFFIIVFTFLFACTKSGEQKDSGYEFLGNWHLEAIKNPKYPYYVYDYSITKNGEGFTVKVHATCPKCKDALGEERNYTFAGNYNENENTFEIEKEGYKEILTIPEMEENMVSSKFPKYIFKKIK